MQRVIIIVLLGIICVSTISSILNKYVLVESDKVLLDTVVGAVGAGNFSYWQLGHIGPIFVELTSLSGDADLYVADTIRPSYESDRNNFSSVTCGPDYVNIPPDFPRPVGIGVFGHWSHFLSEYSIQVFLETVTLQPDVVAMAFKRPQAVQDKTDIERGREKKASRKSSDDEGKPRFMKLLHLLDMMFEMFVM